MRNAARILTLFVLVLVGGCAWLAGDTATEARRQELDAARNRWATANMDSYSYVVNRSCECVYVAATKVVVVRGAVARLELEATGDTLPTDARPSFHTVDELFDVIADAIARDPYQFSADYDPDLGYPTLFSVDDRREIADDELMVTARDMQPLPVF